jgi:gliding motility-associated-like protein
MKKLFLVSGFLFLVVVSFAQRGKNGAANITVANTIVNIYTPLTANASTAGNFATVASTVGFAVGDLVFIIQMQGLSVNCGKDTIFPDFNSAIPTNTTYGAITAYNNCGNYEFAQINNIPNANTLVFDCNLKNNYHALSKCQVINVPRYTTAVISGTGNIVCPQWNGSVGGVVVVEVMNNCTLTAAPSVNVSGLGFRGGAVHTFTLPYDIGNKYGWVGPKEGAIKGESSCGDTTRYQVYSSVHCKGAIANGGGAGDAHNCGGGGGANAGDIALYTSRGNPAAGYNAAWNLESAGFALSTSSGGGRGGYAYSSSNQNPLLVAPGAAAWASDQRRVNGGLGGRPLNYGLGKLFIGGGGGAGHGNDLQAGAGGNGGGLVFMLVYGSLSGAGTILANGANGANTNIGCASNDGGGGGGGGGTIILDIVGGITLTAPTPLSVRGGTGGSVVYNCTNSTAYGPGAGGGGGYIRAVGVVPVNNVAGGVNGIQTGNNNQIGTLFPPNGATAGGSGSTAVTVPPTTISVTNATICVNNTATISAVSGTSAVTWFTAGAGGTSIGGGTTFVSPTYTAPGTFSLWAQPCPGSYRELVQITVTNGPTVSVNSTTICYGAAAVLTASGATSYSWNTGASTVSISASPTLLTVYTVTGTSAGCSASVNGTITVTPIGTIAVNSPTICNGTSTILTAGAAASYTWSTGPSTATISVSPTITTNYTVNATSAGGCLLRNTSTVTVVNIPTVIPVGTSICTGNSGTITASGAANYTWTPGPQTGSAAVVSPTSTQVYTVIGLTGNCSDTKTIQVNVNGNPTISVNSPTICSGMNATVSVSGATTYSWNTGSSSATINPSPALTTVYTVTGTVGSCSTAINSTVNVVTTPTLSINSPTTCSGVAITMTASGATNFTWSTGALTSTESVNPIITTVYTVTGANGNNCNDVKTTTVLVTPQPTVSLNANNFNICGGQSATIIATSNATYSWSTGLTSSVITTSLAGVYDVTVTNVCGSLVQSATVTTGAAPLFTINGSSTVICNSNSITLTTAGSTGTFVWSNGASNTPSISTNIPGLYSATLTNACGTTVATFTLVDGSASALNLASSANTICAGGSVTLTATGTGTFAWSNGAGNVSAITVTNNGVYTVSLTGLCPGAATAAISVSNGPLPALTITSPTTYCQGQTATLSANGSAGTYSWNTGSTGSVITTSTSGTYTAFVTDACGTGTNTFNLIFQTIPSVSLTANKNILCPGENASLTANGVNGGTVYAWSSSANTTNVESINSAGIYTVGYANSCGSSSAAITIAASTLTPDFNFSPNGGIAPVNITFNNTSLNNLTNQWNFGNGAMSTAISPIYNYTASGTYSVILLISNSDGCTASVTKTLDIKATDFGPIPEIFTPNGDGKNDVFEIPGLENYPDAEIEIFNRWGNEIYTMRSYKNDWDGSAQKSGGKLPAGTYYYILKLNNTDNSVYRGYVQVMY